MYFPTIVTTGISVETQTKQCHYQFHPQRTFVFFLSFLSFSAKLTENTRASYPIEFIPNAKIPCEAGHPKNIILLSCDAFGVLPPGKSQRERKEKRKREESREREREKRTEIDRQREERM